MLKVKTPFKVIVGPKRGPVNVSPLEQKLFSKGYRMGGQKYVARYISGWSNELAGKNRAFRVRQWWKGTKCIKVVDRVNNIPNGVIVEECNV